MSESCPLCYAKQTVDYHQKPNRRFLQCRQCNLVFVAKQHLLSLEEETAQYDLHQNSPDDVGYRHFLHRMVDAILPTLHANAVGLDFGCGPGPTLSILFKEQGFTVHDYDPIYRPNQDLLNQPYHFICSTEVLEHIYWPAEILHQLWQLITPGGVLAFMTKRVKNHAAFKTWHYHNDPTHVRFYSESTFTWLANQLGADVSFVTNDIVILHKPR